MPSFDDVARAVAGMPFMSPAQGRLVLRPHRADAGVSDVLELGTAHGVGAAYMAAAGAQRDDRRLRGRGLRPVAGGGRWPAPASPSA